MPHTMVDVFHSAVTLAGRVLLLLQTLLCRSMVYLLWGCPKFSSLNLAKQSVNSTALNPENVSAVRRRCWCLLGEGMRGGRGSSESEGFQSWEVNTWHKGCW